MKTQVNDENEVKAPAKPNGVLDTRNDSRAQPWKQFVPVPTQTKVATFGQDETIRMIEGRVDGKNLGG